MDDILLWLAPWYPSIVALVIFAVIRYIYKNIVLKILRRLTLATTFAYDEEILEAFEQPINVVILVTGLYAAVNVSPIDHAASIVFIDRILRSTIVIAFFWGCYNMSDTTHGLMVEVLGRFGIRSEESVSSIISTMLRILIVLLGFVTIAKEWNYDISGFVASLGIGSLAVAFAAKDALANVFGSLIIILDKPFQIGDWIMANGIEGTVEKITFRSTCVRTFPQELVYIPNSLLSNTPITNFTRREKRRIDFVIGLTYDTTHSQMIHVVDEIRKYLDRLEDVYSDTISVNFVGYGDSSLNVRIICYTKTGVHSEYLLILEKINLQLMQIIEDCGVSCAFPSTSVYFANTLKQQEIKQDVPAVNAAKASAPVK